MDRAKINRQEMERLLAWYDAAFSHARERVDDEDEHVEWEIPSDVLSLAKDRYGPQSRACPSCGASPNGLIWGYSMSPVRDWDDLAGRAGWFTYCRTCQTRVDYFNDLRS